MSARSTAMTERRRFLVVGIGASAGGLEALKLFFQHMGAAPGMAFVVVTHIVRNHESSLVDILQRFTSLPVSAASEGQEIEANHVYVSLEIDILTISGGRLAFRDPGTEQARAKCIDVFFSSLAQDQGENAAAVVLSGLDGDGTLGLKAIKERNGLTLAQVGDGSPKFDSMPQSAIATGLVDLAVPAEDMAQRLFAYAQGMGVLAGNARQDGNGIDLDELLALQARDLRHLVGARRPRLRRLQGPDLYTARPPPLRVPRDGDRRGLRCGLARRPGGGDRALFRDLLINVTDFFRDADAFESLERDVLPVLLEGRTAKDTIRVWVPGCATGEEVFSLAILLKEVTEKLAEAPHVQIFATDIDERALDVARAGRYPAPMMKGVSEERRRRFFTRDGEAFVIGREVRELCIFSAHSVFRDPPFSRVDLVSCRNLLIYLGADVQHQVMPIFHYSLRARGYLFLGLSENVGRHLELFEAVDRKHRIFRARGVHQPMPRLPFALDRNPGFPSATSRSPGVARLRREAELQLLERHSPPYVLVDLAGDVVYFSANTGSFLQPSTGAPSRALIDLVRKGARMEVRSAVRQASETGRAARRTGLRVEVGPETDHTFAVTAEPLETHKDGDPLLLVVFHMSSSNRTTRMGEGWSEEVRDDAANLDAELKDVRERLQATIEEYETSVEELRSSNEELVSMNEEFQSTNEELEASREEMHSLNEELQTVNTELKTNIEQLDTAYEDLRHFFESTETATVFLDSDLAIGNYTLPALDFFRLKPSDKGRSLSDLAMRINYPALERDLRLCLAEGASREIEVEALGGEQRYLLRIRPFDELRGGGRGLVVTATDVTELSKLRAEKAAILSRPGG